MKKVHWTCDNCGKVMTGYDWEIPPSIHWCGFTTKDGKVLDFCSRDCMGEVLSRGIKRDEKLLHQR